MANEWIQEALGSEHHIILFLSFDAKRSVETYGTEAAFKIGIHPGLRHVSPEMFDMIMEALEEGVEKLRNTPLDDLHLIKNEDWLR